MSRATQGQLPVTWQRPVGPETSSKEQNPCSSVSSPRVQGRWFKRLQFGELEKVFQKDESIEVMAGMKAGPAGHANG